MDNTQEMIIRELQDKGVVIPDPRQVYVAPEVDPHRIYSGCVLYPGTRLTGGRTLIGSGAEIGTEGPAVVCDSQIGAGAEIASGYLKDSVLLPGAKAGANSHYRGGTLLEEEASTAHCCGLKQSVLMYAVTLGSLINLCDVLFSGGTSRKDHTEVGSGFIHFNFTPWGKSGDKATATMAGNVTEGVFLDQPRIFLGGMSGLVGPDIIGFGAMTAAGQVTRQAVPANTMHGEQGRAFDRDFVPGESAPTEAHKERVRSRCMEYMVQLAALKAWYRNVRMKRSKAQGDTELGLVYEGAVTAIDTCMKERFSRYNKFAQEWGLSTLEKSDLIPGFRGEVPVPDWKCELPYDQWIRALSSEEKEALHSWLDGVADSVRRQLEQRSTLPVSREQL